MAEKFEISTEEFEQRLEEQKQQSEILKFSELETDSIYKITDADVIETKNGKACIITLHSDEKVWATSLLIKKLEKLQPPLLLRPKGKKKSENGREYYNFDLVKYNKK